MDNPNVVWAIWLGLTLAGFGVVEGLALATKHTNWTLSATLRRWLGVQPVKPWRWAGVLVFAGFLCWLILHITAGLP